MNLHSIVAPYTSKVNPLEQVLLLRSAGPVTSPSGKRTPQYMPAVTIFADVQALGYNDLMNVEGLNIQGYRRALYIDGRSYGVNRPSQLGGDLFVRKDGTTWLNVHVLEPWLHWTKFVITLQDYSAVENVPPLDFSNPSDLTYTVEIKS